MGHASRCADGAHDLAQHFRTKAASDARVFVDDEDVGLNVDQLAAQLRDDLARAEVDRAKLFQGSRNRLRMRAHDPGRRIDPVHAAANGMTDRGD